MPWSSEKRLKSHVQRELRQGMERLQPSRQRDAGRKWYRSEIWKRLRREHLAENPYCVECLKEGIPIGRAIGNTVDHITPHDGDWELFSDPANFQTLCHRHHSVKTCRQDGGFGHRRKE